MADPKNEDGVELGTRGVDKTTDIHTERIERIDTNLAGKDKAALLLKAAGHSVVVTAEENKRILSKIDWHILP